MNRIGNANWMTNNEDRLNLIHSHKTQIKITKCHFSFNVFVKIKNMDNSKGWQRCGEMGTIKHHW